ncbi:FadR/GntR family transcriptional regulator [Phycicoccus avicenniae]|uniref:FadR/GntR family transcriptional regulator n=1 Tax=Phycicoccus avicenniae TaxID=2828860 RepID=UPI003D2A1983
MKGLVLIPLDDVDPLRGVVEVSRPSMAEDVARRLVTAIAVGTYSPGERLPAERELAALLGVSRVTLRQALQQVADLGLIASRRGRGGGTFVTTQSWEKVAPEQARRTLEVELPRLRDLFDARCLLEGLVARTAAERRTQEEADALRATLDEFAAAGADMVVARALDRRLHGLVGAATRNPHLVTMSARLTAAATLGFGAEPYATDFFERALHEHRELVDAVVDADPERAQRVATAHFALTYETMERSLRLAVDRAE